MKNGEKHMYMLFIKRYFYQAAVTIKISNLLICFCSFDLSCHIVKKDGFIENFKRKEKVP